jgi:UDP-3-O-[3-hydroxymyristoyl] glucosamine N-acyltransferase
MKVEDIARALGATAYGDTQRDITGIAGLDIAGPTDLTFADGARALEQAIRSQAGCILVPVGASLPDRTTIPVAQPKLALIRAVEAILPAPRMEPGIHPSAVIAASARLAEDVTVGPHVVIGEEVTIGARTALEAGVVIGRKVEIGADAVLHANVHIYPGARIGNRVVIHAGSVIGADGFGYVFAEGRHVKFPQLGGVLIEDDVEIGSNSTIDRGALGLTVIGQGTKIDNLVQVAHNVRIGRHCAISAQTGIAGSSVIGDYVVLAGQVGISDKVRIEDRVIIGAQSGIPTGKLVRAGSMLLGTPARSLASFKKIYAQWVNLPNLGKKVQELSRLMAAQSKGDKD